MPVATTSMSVTSVDAVRHAEILDGDACGLVAVPTIVSTSPRCTFVSGTMPIAVPGSRETPQEDATGHLVPGEDRRAP